MSTGFLQSMGPLLQFPLTLVRRMPAGEDREFSSTIECHWSRKPWLPGMCPFWAVRGSLT